MNYNIYLTNCQTVRLTNDSRTPFLLHFVAKLENCAQGLVPFDKLPLFMFGKHFPGERSSRQVNLGGQILRLANLHIFFLLHDLNGAIRAMILR